MEDRGQAKNKDGLKIDGVTYTQKDASKEGAVVEL